jgi:hypothetical protein
LGITFQGCLLTIDIVLPSLFFAMDLVATTSFF